MSIEPSQVRTVCIRPVLPPKPEAKIKVPLLSGALVVKRHGSVAEWMVAE